MLQKLYITNYVIIDELTINFDHRLNVLTGETGAGKSIIVGALSLILGDRANTSVLINKEKKCIVEATFDISGKTTLQQLMEEEGLDIDSETIIRREISTKGKSRAFVNDTPVKLVTLNKITDFLVDLHRQFDQYLMRHGNFVYDILDAVSDNQKVKQDYQKTFQHFQSLSRQFETAMQEKAAWQREKDYKEFLLSELEEADFQQNELEEAEGQLKELSHAEDILKTLQNLHFSLEESEPAINGEIRRLTQDLEGVLDVFPNSEGLYKRLESIRIELEDIAAEANIQAGDLNWNPEKLQILQDRLDMGYRLLKKHQVQTTAELQEIKAKLSQELTGHNAAEQELEALEKEKDKVFKSVEQKAQNLHHNRVKSAPIFAGKVNELLHLIGLPNAVIKITINPLEDYNNQGSDKVQFLWDANKSNQFQAIQKSASGGELSRVMLCIKALTAEAIALPTLVFDEVDTGVSGEAAKQVALLLQKLSGRHQILCITHQPQVAGRGNKHFFVYKSKEQESVKTHIRSLGKTEQIQAIAQMIGGESPSQAALESARELVDS